MHMMKLCKSFLFLLFTVFFLSACSGEKVEEPSDPIEVGEEDEAVQEPESPYTAPLTGVGTDQELERRVVGVTINNHPAARPQSGLIDADIVYEVLAEGEMTRFVALFHSKLPERVGPVRSARPYLIDLVKGYNGMYVAHGWSPEAEQMLKNGYADHLNGLFYDGTLFERSSDRKAPHNSYITFDHILEGMESTGYDINGDVPPLSFKADLDIDGVASEKIDISYLNRNNVQYRYDAESGLYTRYNDEKQTVDYETDEPIEIANVLVVEADHRILDDVGRRAIDLESGGQALLFQNGVARTVQWENNNGQIIPVQDGEAVLLKPGQTWINIVPTSPGIESSVTYIHDEEVNGDHAN